jgi:hypothetical protein
MGRWYYSPNGEAKHGPVDSKTLRSLVDDQVITPDSLVWREGLRHWVKAAHVKGLFSEARPVASPPDLPPPARSQDRARAFDANEIGVTDRRSVARDTGQARHPPTHAWRALAAAAVIGVMLWNLESIGSLFVDGNWQRSVAGDLDELASRAQESLDRIARSGADGVSDGVDDALSAPRGTTAFNLAAALGGDTTTRTAPTIKGLSLDMTPDEFTNIAPRVNPEAAVTDGAIRGFWSGDRSMAPVSEVPADATGLWYFGYSIPPINPPATKESSNPTRSADEELLGVMLDAAMPGREAARHWHRVGWVMVEFDTSHLASKFAIKARRHYGPSGPAALPENDLSPPELAERILASCELPSLRANDSGNGWECVNRDGGWRVDFVCAHWTSESAGAGVKSEFLRFTHDQLVEFAEQASLAQSLGGFAGLAGDAGPAVLANIARKLDTAWVLVVTRVSKSESVSFE